MHYRRQWKGRRNEKGRKGKEEVSTLRVYGETNK
jgi:hypothetical protein